MGGPKIMANYLQATANEYQRGKQLALGATRMDNPVFQRSSDMMMMGPGGSSVSSRRSSSDTLSSNSPTGGTGGTMGQILNPLNPRSGSQRYAKNGMLRLPTTTKVSPTVYALQSPPSPSIHSSGLPDPKTLSISADPMPNGRGSRQQQQQQGSVAGSIASSSAHSLQFSTRSGSDVSLQQALRDNILGSGTGTCRDLTRIQWPRNSIPRRVKKLSWEDEYGTTEACRDRDMTLMTDPNVSVTPMLDGLSEPSQPVQIGRAIFF